MPSKGPSNLLPQFLDLVSSLSSNLVLTEWLKHYREEGTINAMFRHLQLRIAPAVGGSGPGAVLVATALNH